MREPYPTWDLEFSKSYHVLEFSRLSLYSIGVPVEVLRSLTEGDMETLRDFLINWYASPNNFTQALRWIVNAYLTGKGWEWEYDTESDEVFITKRPPDQTGGKE